MPDEAPAPFPLTRDQIDTHLDGAMAGIMRETFAVDERITAWDTMVPTVMQYLASDTAPSLVAVVPIGLANLGDPPQAVEFLTRTMTSDEPGAARMRDRVVRAHVGSYLGCAVAIEAFRHSMSRHDRQERFGDVPTAEVPGVEEVRLFQGITAWGRRFVLVRVRGTNGDVDNVAAVVDVPHGDDETHPTKDLKTLVGRLNQVLIDAYDPSTRTRAQGHASRVDNATSRTPSLPDEPSAKDSLQDL